MWDKFERVKNYGSVTSANRLKDAHKNIILCLEEIMLSCLFKIHKHFSFIFVTFCAFQALFVSMLGPFYTKSCDLDYGFSFHKLFMILTFWGIKKLPFCLKFLKFFHWIFSFFCTAKTWMALVLRVNHRVLARSNKSSINFWK